VCLGTGSSSLNRSVDAVDGDYDGDEDDDNSSNINNNTRTMFVADIMI